MVWLNRFLSFALLLGLFAAQVSAAENCSRSLRDIYHDYFNRLTRTEIPRTEREILEILERNPELKPDSTYITEKGAMANNFSLEVNLTNRFIREFHIWRSKIERSKLITHQQLSQIGLNIYARAILKEGPLFPREISNLSLIYDNIYGSHLYEFIDGVDVYRWTHFLSTRRQLAMTQSSFIANISADHSKERAERLHDELQDYLVHRPVKLTKDRKVIFLEKWAPRLFFWLPPMKKLIQEIFLAVEPASPIDPIGTNIAKKYLEESWMPDLLRNFRIKMADLEKRLRNREDSVSDKVLEINVFDIALDVADGDIEKAVVLVGLMSIQRKALIRKLARHYANAGKLDDFYEPLTDTVATYYLITDIAETMDTIKRERGVLKERYSFLYPKGYRVNDNKFYHFWSEVFFSFHLREQGFSKLAVKTGLSSVGVAYELATSASGIEFFREFGMSRIRAFRATKMFDDMKLHRYGVKYGLQLHDQANK